jgi:hypothetical protein
MSATRDKSQKTTFVYSNLYQLYRKGKVAAGEASVSVESRSSYFEIPSESNVLKVGDLKAEARANALKVDPFSPPELIGKRLDVRAAESRLQVVSPERIPLGKPVSPASDSAVFSLKQNLIALQDLHSRLRFMLKELEELSKDDE